MHGATQCITNKKRTVYNYWCMTMNENFQNQRWKKGEAKDYRIGRTIKHRYIGNYIKYKWTR